MSLIVALAIWMHSPRDPYWAFFCDYVLTGFLYFWLIAILLEGVKQFMELFWIGRIYLHGYDRLDWYLCCDIAEINMLPKPLSVEKARELVCLKRDKQELRATKQWLDECKDWRKWRFSFDYG